MIYFVTWPIENCPIKIGYTEDADRLDGRMSTFQTGSPWKVDLMLVIEGGRALEREFHTALRSSRMRGEWFARTPELLALISLLRRRKASAGELRRGEVIELLDEIIGRTPEEKYEAAKPARKDWRRTSREVRPTPTRYRRRKAPGRRVSAD